MPSDLAIPIVFPNYLIAVNTPAQTVDLPDLPYLPDRVTIPATRNRLPHLGHAGILFANGASGLTKYYEYGRYDPAALGLVRRVGVPDLTVRGGRPTAASLRTVLGAVSRKSGQGGKILGAYIELQAGAFAAMLQYALTREAQNSLATRAPYELLSNSCLHFMRGVAEAGGAAMPWVIDPRPVGYIERVRGVFPALDYAPLAITGVTLP